MAADPLLPRAVLGLATLAGLLLALGVLLPRSWASPAAAAVLGPIRRLALAVASNAGVSLAAIFLLAAASGAANGLVRMPVPSVNDEFSYLLGADTFAQGRIANPQHPMWRHFETIGVSHRPAYVSKYPPAAAGFLAVGQVLTGHPWWGQLLAYALACTAVAWMLRAWVGPRWALIGGVLVALHPTMQHFQRYDHSWSNYSWSHSYWGGAVAMLGGALLFGGLRRFVRDGRARDASWLGVGLMVLANSRPFEGLLVALPVAGIVLWRAAQGHPHWTIFLRRFVLPVAAVVVPALVFMLFYNETTTGSPLRLAHQHYSDQYGVAAELLFLPAHAPPESYGNKEMERFYLEWVRPKFLAQASSWDHYWHHKKIGAKRFVWFYLGLAWPALLGVLPLLGRRWWRLAAAMAALSFGLVFVTFEFHPHYAAPVAPLILALLVVGMMRLWGVRGAFSRGARALVLGIILMGTLPRLYTLPGQDERIDVRDWPRQRAAIEQGLAELPGRDLVIVAYLPTHSVFMEWVKNAADLDGAPVVWARDLGDETSRARLVQHYGDRRIWVLRADEHPPALLPYEEVAGPPPPRGADLRLGSSGDASPAMR